MGLVSVELYLLTPSREAVSDQLLKVLNGVTLEMEASALTDENGRAVVELNGEEEAGDDNTYVVVTAKTGWGFTSANWIVVYDPATVANSFEFTFTPPEQPTATDTRFCCVSGVLASASGSVATDSLIRFFGTEIGDSDTNFGAVTSAVTDSNGQFSVNVLRSQKYDILHAADPNIVSSGVLIPDSASVYLADLLAPLALAVTAEESEVDVDAGGSVTLSVDVYYSSFVWMSEYEWPPNLVLTAEATGDGIVSVSLSSSGLTIYGLTAGESVVTLTAEHQGTQLVLPDEPTTTITVTVT